MMVWLPDTAATGPPPVEGANPSSRRPAFPSTETADTKSSKRSGSPDEGENGELLLLQAPLHTATDNASTAESEYLENTERPFLVDTGTGERRLTLSLSIGRLGDALKPGCRRAGVNRPRVAGVANRKTAAERPRPAGSERNRRSPRKALPGASREELPTHRAGAAGAPRNRGGAESWAPAASRATGHRTARIQERPAHLAPGVGSHARAAQSRGDVKTSRV